MKNADTYRRFPKLGNIFWIHSQNLKFIPSLMLLQSSNLCEKLNPSAVHAVCALLLCALTRERWKLLILFLSKGNILSFFLLSVWQGHEPPWPNTQGILSCVVHLLDILPFLSPQEGSHVSCVSLHSCPGKGREQSQTAVRLVRVRVESSKERWEECLWWSAEKILLIHQETKNLNLSCTKLLPLAGICVGQQKMQLAAF